MDAFEVPPHVIPVAGTGVHPFGLGVDTVTCTVPAAMISAAGTAAVIPVGPTNVVINALGPQLTTEQGSKLFPITESTNAPPPTGMFEGIRELMDGTGKDVGSVGVKLREFVLIAGPDTKTGTGPGEATSA